VTGGLRSRIVGLSLALVLLVGLPFALLIGAIDQLRSSSELSAQGEAVAASAQKVERMLLDIQTSHRGYVLSGDELFLEPWTAARETLPAELAQLKALADDPAQQRRAAAIEEAVRSYVEEYAAPLVAQARESRSEATRTIATGEGERRVDALRTLMREFEDAQTSVSERRSDRVERQAGRAINLSAAGLAGSALLVLLFGAYLARSVAVPVRRTAESARRLAGGDLGARTQRGGPREVDELALSFNEMADSLEESRDELESQNAELEAQQAELEDALAELGAEQARLRELYGFGERVAGRTAFDDLCGTVVQRLCDLAAADVGALYVVDESQHDVPCLVTTRGLDPAKLPRQLDEEGLAGMAVAERRSVIVAPGEAATRVAALGRELEVRHELHLPLVHAERAVGVLSLGRVADSPFGGSELELLEHLAAQAAVAIANAVSYREASRLAQINRAVLDATTDGIRMVDLEGNTVLTNAAMDAMAGSLELGDDGSVGKLSAELAERTRDPAAYRAAVDSIRTDPERELLDEFHLVDHGRWLQRYTAPVRYPGGAVIGRIFVLRDVTPEREAEQMKSDLMATVSHELRTPLASILGFSELLAERELEPEATRHHVRTIHAEAQRLTNLIDDFLDLQRIEEGGLRIELQAVDLVPLLRQTIELYAAQSSRHSVELEAPDEPIVVLAEPERIAQVVGNLLSNAVKYSPEGGTVAVRASVAEDAVRIAVHDEGLGIPAAQQDRIFEKFFRVDTSDTRRIGGTGLGLALSREIVEAHGGRMGFVSAEGRGSTFWLELPAGRRVNGRGRVLVIADDRDLAALLVDWIAADGHAADVATSGSAGLERAERDRPALICLDVGLGGSPDGWAVLEELKVRPTTSAIPVVVCTAGKGDRRAAVLGAADVLAKPFTAEQLRSTLTRVLPPNAGNLLVVDDEAAVRRLVVETLAGEGLRLREASNGTEALAAVAAEIPDAIVLDLAMPEVDGFEVLAELQKKPETREVPVVVLTGKRLSPAERNLLKRRAVSLMEKNAYSALELRSLIRAALGNGA
jgi:signal transduction histidine kinase/DNA-binding response OmpR family regulator/CHASE3 domain sensor protein